ncbi:peroxidase [Bacillus fungorum]|uniref:Peroxidase n=1 Tax=Bacillus fungorum TaxID=2039284 RepID=A0A2G6Q5N0_9BACI|nr:Dyp-type peroxidase [Bacillus fungorum]PIE92146.1 peroxidase [Bacillus fungorum]
MASFENEEPNRDNIASLEQEPLLHVDQIQGNILGGFNKDFQQFLFFEIVDPNLTKQWIQSISSQISTTQEVVMFNRLYQMMWARRGSEPTGLIATWMNIAFSYAGLKKLVSEESLKDFSKSGPFAFGMKKRSGKLGDPRDQTSEGNPKNWVIGGDANSPDILLVIASDSELELTKKVQDIKTNSTVESGLKLVYEEAGRDRNDLPGREHFGFRDGISQPAVRGRFSTAPGDMLTKRWVDPSDEAFLTDAELGEKLVWPGEFVFGYPAQSDASLDPVPMEDKDLPINYGVPVWAKNGSFLVVRRLRQDVAGFWEFLTEKGKELNMCPTLMGTKMVGRWPSGAPLMRSSEADNHELAKDDHANNHFLYESNTPDVKLSPDLNYTDPFPKAKEDFFGKLCPISAHIRKVNPRDSATDIVGAFSALTRRILRRGIPFGSPLNVDMSMPPYSDTENGNRGLMFLCYQTRIEFQFEFLTQRWANSPEFPTGSRCTSSGDVCPTPGEDPIIGQNGNDSNGNRSRSFTYAPNQSMNIMKEFVIPTGGEYYFQPSIDALKTVIGNQA